MIWGCFANLSLHNLGSLVYLPVMPKRALVLQALLVIIAAATSAQRSGDSSDRALIARARKMYYSLQREGVRELKCRARPDWPEVLASMPSVSADFKQRAMPHLSTSEFKVTMTEWSTNVAVDPANRISGELPSDVAAVVEWVRSDIQQEFEMWRMTTFKPLLPGPKVAYHLEHRAGKYELIDGKQQRLELDEAGLIQSFNDSIPDEHVTISMPMHYDQTSHGLVLSSIALRTQNDSSPRLEMTVQYLEQDGLQLPSVIDSKSEHALGKVSTEVRFDQYEVLRR